MTLARTALRISAIEALIGQTRAEGRVFDSKWSDLAPESYPDDGLPCIIVLTDAEDGDELLDQNGGPPFRRVIELVLEMSIIQTIDVSGQENPDTGQLYPSGSYLIDHPASDRQTEASLDLLEHQATYALAAGDSEAAQVFRSFTRIKKKEGHRQITDETGVKVAIRVVTFKIDTQDDQHIPFYPGDDVMLGLEALPEPLRSVALALPLSSPRRQLCESLAAALAPQTNPEFAGMDIQIDAGAGENGSDIVDVSVEIQNSGMIPQIVPNAGEVVIDYARGTYQNLILSADVTSMTVINWPQIGKTGRLILQVTQLGNFAIDAWPDGTVWSDGGGEPTISTGAGKRDIYVLTTASHGAEIFGNVIGQDYA